jgi:hypothetical protein
VETDRGVRWQSVTHYSDSAVHENLSTLSVEGLPIEQAESTHGLVLAPPRELHWLQSIESSDGQMEAFMTFKIADVGTEAELIEIGQRLSDALSSAHHRTELLDLSPDYVDAAKTMLAELSGEAAALPLGTVALTKQQVESFLDFDPVFLDTAKDMLRAFIEKTEGMGMRESANGD